MNSQAWHTRAHSAHGPGTTHGHHMSSGRNWKESKTVPINLYSSACFLQAEVEQGFQIVKFSFFKVFDGLEM